MGKNGERFMVDGEGIDLRTDEPVGRGLEDVGKAMVVRGILRHTGPYEPPAECEVGDESCPSMSAPETYYFDEATPEFVALPPPPLASQVGNWVALRGRLDRCKAGPCVVTEGGPVYLEGHAAPVLDDRTGARVVAFGVLKHASRPFSSKGGDQGEQLAHATVLQVVITGGVRLIPDSPQSR